MHFFKHSFSPFLSLRITKELYIIIFLIILIFKMKTKLRVVLFCSLILLLLFLTTLRSIWNADYSHIPLVPNEWSSEFANDVIKSDQIEGKSYKFLK